METPPQASTTHAGSHTGRRGCVAAFLLLAATGLQPLSAQLGSLDKNPWFGFFAGYSNRNFRIGLMSDGQIKLNVLEAQGEPVHVYLEIPIVFSIGENLSDGRVVNHPIDPNSLQSEQAPTAELGKVLVHGKTAGDAEFELTFEQNRDMILIGGRVLSQGSLKNPLHITLRADFTRPYPHPRKDFDEKASKDFRKIIRRDHIALKWPDNRARKIMFIEDGKKEKASPVEADLSGITEAKIDIISYGGKKFTFLASPHSAISLDTKPRQQLPGDLSLLHAFSLSWRSLPGNDPNGETKLAIEVR